MLCWWCCVLMVLIWWCFVDGVVLMRMCWWWWWWWWWWCAVMMMCWWRGRGGGGGGGGGMEQEKQKTHGNVGKKNIAADDLSIARPYTCSRVKYVLEKDWLAKCHFFGVPGRRTKKMMRIFLHVFICFLPIHVSSGCGLLNQGGVLFVKAIATPWGGGSSWIISYGVWSISQGLPVVWQMRGPIQIGQGRLSHTLHISSGYVEKEHFGF